jgi:uncharacterized phage-associated protein
MAAPKIDSVELAKFILAKLGGMPPLKLQKLVYYVEAWHLAIFKESIILDRFRAWVHGPVSLKILHVFKSSASPVFNDVTVSARSARRVVAEVEAVLKPEQLDLIKDVLKEYGGLSAYELEALTHSELPWREARTGIASDEPSNAVISKATMQKFYRNRLYKN